MQSSGSGSGGPSRNPGVGPAGHAMSSSSSQSSPSTPHLGFDTLQHQHQHIGSTSRPSLQQPLLRKPEGNEAFLAYQAGLQGVVGTNNLTSPSSLQLPQQSRNSIDFTQHGFSQEAQMRGQGMGQQMPNPVHQAYLQYALQAAQQKSALSMQPHQQAKMGMLGSSAVKDQEMHMGNLKMQGLIPLQGGNQAQGSQGQQHQAMDHKNVGKSSTLGPASGHIMPTNVIRPMQAPTNPQGIQNVVNNQMAVSAQMHAIQAWAHEHNIDLSHPANANLMPQLISMMQSKRVSQQKPNAIAHQPSSVPVSKQQVTFPMENPAHSNSSSDLSGKSGCANARQTVPPSHFVPSTNAGTASSGGDAAVQQRNIHGRESQTSLRQPVAVGNGLPPVHSQQFSPKNHVADNPFNARKSPPGSDLPQVQHTRQFNQSSAQTVGPTRDGTSRNHVKPLGAPAQMPQQRPGFTKQQLQVLKAQILALRRLKKGESTLPQELLEGIVPPPLELQLQQTVHPAGGQNTAKSAGSTMAEHTRPIESKMNDSQPISAINEQSSSRQEVSSRDAKLTSPTVQMHAMPVLAKEASSFGKEQQQSIQLDQEDDHGIYTTPVRTVSSLEKGKAIVPHDTVQLKKPAQTSPVTQLKDVASTKKYLGPLFDFPSFTWKPDSSISPTVVNNNDLSLAYDVKDLLYEEGKVVFTKRREENLKKIEGLLAVNLERKRIRPDLVLRLQIEEKKLRLLDLQAQLRDEIDRHQQEIMAMPDRPYRKFVKLCERQRMELARRVQASQRALREKQLKPIFQWRKKLLEAHWAVRDARIARNRGVGKYHERTLREFSKLNDDDRDKRMEALKNNDVDRYKEMLHEQQTNLPDDAAERYAVLSSFLTQTEDYLQKLGSKITAAKSQQEVEEAARAAAAAARLQGLSEEEVRAAAACAREEVMVRNRFMEMNAPRDSPSVSKYYSLAHAVNEKVIRQPSMLRAGTLRDYQLVGLQWMLSLYNNKLNGILADEMGLGKTVQVMALIAYLMEFKGNYGPHLIIVPNAVLVNWKSELYNWLPSVSCIFYVGAKDQRSKLFSQEVCAMKFNVLVTTYEFIMYDRSKLSRIDWKYIIIDEAQRMKDRDSVLARDLDRYHCQRRLLLTGTPLQNDLKELWSLLNLLLPDVFDNRKAFHDWFSKPFQKEDPTQIVEDDWLETEKKVIIIHRLHQILEPFMLRRRVEDVEGSLPPKVSIVLRCKMSAIQSAIYDWIKSTGTLRLDPEDEKLRVQRNPLYQVKQYKPLTNRCMELRKTCNHPLLNYPYFHDLSKDFLVKSCGKLWILDRILIKLQRTGHRVLLFSTMTKLLDIIEEYLQWRRFVYRRIDGTTTLEDRETAIVDFNSPGSDCFIFLLSIRAAGRGLNLQSADTVIIYDPDPNPKNEEQAVARAHRIGQTREVKVLYMEAVVDQIPSHQKEDEHRSGGGVNLKDELAGKGRYVGSIESLIRNNIQQYKIGMADEVINAGRFDQRTTHEERRMTLETLLHDEERYQETVHDVPSLQEVNRMIARSEDELELFDQMDEELDWTGEMTQNDQVPKWLRASTKEVNATIAALSKRPSKNTVFGGSIPVESSEMGSDASAKTERRRGRPKGKKHPIYKELEDENGESSEASYGERNVYSANEEGDIGEFEDDGYSGDDGAQLNNKYQMHDGPPCNEGYEIPHPSERMRNSHMNEEAASLGSSSDSQRMTQTIFPSVSSQKFGSLSALDSKPISISKRKIGDLEEREIAVSGDSHMDRQQSGSWIHDCDGEEDGQVLRPKLKRKRSHRRPRHAVDRVEEKYSSVMTSLQHGESAHLAIQADHKYHSQSRIDHVIKSRGEVNAAVHDQKRISPLKRATCKSRSSLKSGRLNCISDPSEDGDEQLTEKWEGKHINSRESSAICAKMSEIVQRKCKDVISRFQRIIDKEGCKIVPLLTDLWKKNSGHSGGSGNNWLDMQKIDQRIDRFEYNGVLELVCDVQFMLKCAMDFYGFSHEVRYEARKVHDLFFDILKFTFPDMDFQGPRIALSFAAPTSVSSLTSPRQMAGSSSKRHKLINEVENDSSPSPKRMHRGIIPSGESTRISVHLPPKDSRTGTASISAREQIQQDESLVLTHPGELVVCKKRRNDRDKSSGKIRGGSAGPVSPPSSGPAMRSPGPSSGSKDSRLSQQPAQGSGGSAGWANPVKRSRSGSGKRRRDLQ